MSDGNEVSDIDLEIILGDSQVDLNVDAANEEIILDETPLPTEELSDKELDVVEQAVDYIDDDAKVIDDNLTSDKLPVEEIEITELPEEELLSTKESLDVDLEKIDLGALDNVQERDSNEQSAPEVSEERAANEEISR